MKNILLKSISILSVSCLFAIPAHAIHGVSKVKTTAQNGKVTYEYLWWCDGSDKTGWKGTYPTESQLDEFCEGSVFYDPKDISTNLVNNMDMVRQQISARTVARPNVAPIANCGLDNLSLRKCQATLKSYRYRKGNSR